MGSNRKRYYIVEGETEETFWRYLIESNYVSPGKVKIFNLMQSSLNTTDTLFVNRQAEFFGVLDTDVTDQDNLQKLYKNVLSLRSNGNVKLLMQNKNFENELCKIFSCQISQLYEIVGCKANGIKNLKRHLAKMTSQDYQRKLQDCRNNQKPDLLKYCNSIHPDVNDYLASKKLDNIITFGYKIIKIR